MFPKPGVRLVGLGAATPGAVSNRVIVTQPLKVVAVMLRLSALWPGPHNVDPIWVHAAHTQSAPNEKMGWTGAGASRHTGPLALLSPLGARGAPDVPLRGRAKDRPPWPRASLVPVHKRKHLKSLSESDPWREGPAVFG